MQRILVATDLSERSERALRRSFQLAAELSAQLTVLNVVDDAMPGPLAAQLKASTAESLAELCAHISTEPHNRRVEIGDPLKVIHDVADEIDADLIVLGVHRARPLVDWLGGTTMERLVRKSLRPVLLVKSPAGRSYAQAVCGLDFSPASLAALEAVAAIAPAADVTTFHAVHVPFRGMLAPEGSAEQLAPFFNDAQARLDEWLGAVTLPPRCAPPKLIAAGVSQAMMQTVREASADLIAIGAHGRPSLSPTYLGGFAEDLLRAPPCDILVVRR